MVQRFLIAMAINKKRDFKKLSACIQEFLARLPCDETTGFLRDTLCLSLLELHKYYIKEKDRLNLSLQQSNEIGTTSLHSTHKQGTEYDKYDRRWYGHNQTTNEAESKGFLAALEGNIDYLKETVQLSDCVDALGQTYLMYVLHGRSANEVECIEYLLSQQVDINKQANDGSTALHLACQFVQKSSVETLLKHKARTTLQDKKGRAPLHWAAMSPSSIIMKLLLQHGADISAKDCDGMTPAMWACHFDQQENFCILKNALERVDPRPEAIFDERDHTGGSVIHWAVPFGNKNGSLQCLKELLVGDISWVRDYDGRTVLHTAATQGSVLACELILSLCGKEILNNQDKQGQTALHLATLCGQGEAVDYLLQSGANTSEKNVSDRTALQEAECGHYHYCLLVFTSFEQMREASTEKLKERQHNKQKKKYESWVIPTGILQDSQEIPEGTTNSEPGHLNRQLVDVTDMKGFEVNGNVESPCKPTDKIAEPTKKASPKTNQSALLQRNNRPEEVNKDEELSVCDEGQLQQQNAVQGKEVTPVCNDEHLQERLDYSSQYSQQHDRVTSMASNNTPDEESDCSISENIEISSLGDDNNKHYDSDLEHEHSDQEDKQSKTCNKSKPQPKTIESKNVLNSQGFKGQNLASIKPLTQPTFSMPAKLDSIPASLSSKTNHKSKNSQSMQSRGIVAPLQPPPPLPPPPHQTGSKEHQRQLLQGTRLHSNQTTIYGSRRPGHGPLAESHSKALLKDVHKTPAQKTPEKQKRVTHYKPGKLSHPQRH